MRASRGRGRLVLGATIRGTDDHRPHSPPAPLRPPESAKTLPAGHLPSPGVRWALYARSGGGDLAQAAQQFAVMEDAVARLGGTIVSRFSDLGLAGAGRSQLIDAARQGRVDRVMVWDLHQLGRQHDAAAQTVETLRGLGVGVTLAKTGQDVDDPLIALTSAAARLGAAAARPRRRPRSGR
ncbi:recombinase family protein [Streptosporangium sp. NPDC002721]|uniref:recombinase family protein n=1 Tax=Streptosporangium sp. NPDC002721 TaxID=3366188 RepID=UPI00369BF577